MPYTKKQLQELTKTYGRWGGWAVWKDESCFFSKLDPASLHTNYVIVGLNISRPLFCPWSNFRGGKHDIKIEKVFDIEPFRGCYMTDIVKAINKDSATVLRELRNKPEFKTEQVNFFRKELLKLGVSEQTRFILFGSAVRKYFDDFVNDEFKGNPRYHLPHYSSYSISNNEWIKSAKRILRKKPD